MEIDISNRGHARLSASGTKTWANCPGSIAFMEKFPVVEVASEYAMEGTAAHHLVEHCLKTGTNPIEYLDRVIKIIDPDLGAGTSMLRKGAKLPTKPGEVAFIVDHDMIEATTHMTDYVQRRCFELDLTDEVSAKAVAELVKKGTVKLEVKVNPLPNRDDTGGSVDVLIDAWPMEMEVVDYKHGRGVFVPVNHNPQTKSYLLGGILDMGAESYETSRHTICQPRHMSAPEDGIMTEELEPLDVIAWGTWLEEAALEVDVCRGMMDANATLDDLFMAGKLSVGEDGSHCTFCELKTRCPAAYAKAQELAMTDFDDEPMEIETAGENYIPIFLPWVPFLDKLIKAYKGQAEKIMLAGRTVEDHKLVVGRSSRKWKGSVTMMDLETEEEFQMDLTDKALQDMMKSEYKILKADVYVEPKAITAPQMETLLKSKGLDKEGIKYFNERFIDKTEGKLTVAHKSSPKAAVVIADAAGDFDDVDDDMEDLI